MADAVGHRVVSDCFGCGRAAEADSAAARLPSTIVFSGAGGLPVDWAVVLGAMDAADVIVIGEAHADFAGHAIQTALLEVAVLRWPGLTLSLEEFDRSQQAELDAFSRGEMTGAQLYEIRAFVDLKVKANWQDWYLPKLAVARDAGVPLLASNAPLKYSRMVRNHGCRNLPELEKAELALFDCPSVTLDPEYRARFARTFTSAVKRSDTGGVKQLND